MELDEEAESEKQSFIDLTDFEVIPRPQELISVQLKSSGKKSGIAKSKFDGSLTSKVLSHHKDVKRAKDKFTNKAVSKAKSARKSSSSGGIKVHDLEKKYKFHAKSVSKKHTVLQEHSSKVSGHELPEKLISKIASSETDGLHGGQEFFKKMDEPAVTAQEKLNVLLARDNVIRLKGKQRGSGTRKIIGCCPDMCPEKERYSRIVKNCLSVLEMKMALDSTTTSRDADHRFMVKEYSRSSADQQEPLLHELRPVPILMLTMDYLICNIMHMKLDNISLRDWYDFIWNRTRSIRKDITQQQFCDLECVEIIEKCVRFHIHCAEALSEEETTTFDPKINNENLNKCLQTLKHMYYDLQSKGIDCPNEAEFRAYDILLSLNEGETLRLVKDIRKDVFKSPLVKSAFEAALAYKSHNYVKFFKLIEKATYLNSCILHRYIYDARISAMQVMVRAYSTQHNSTEYPISSLVRDLKFENSAEACTFCKWCNLIADETYVTIDRRAFRKPASSLPVARSLSLVEKKLDVPLGMLVSNGTLPQNPLLWYFPSSSFNERNILKKDSTITDNQEDTLKKADVGPQASGILQSEENCEISHNSSKEIDTYYPLEPKSSVPVKAKVSVKENYFRTPEKTSAFCYPYEKDQSYLQSNQKQAQFSKPQNVEKRLTQENDNQLSSNDVKNMKDLKSLSFRSTQLLLATPTTSVSKMAGFSTSKNKHQKDELESLKTERTVPVLHTLQNAPSGPPQTEACNLNKVTKTPASNFSFVSSNSSFELDLPKQLLLKKDKSDHDPIFFQNENLNKGDLKSKENCFQHRSFSVKTIDSAFNLKDVIPQLQSLPTYDNSTLLKLDDARSLTEKLEQQHEACVELADELCFQYVEEHLVSVCEAVLVTELRRLIKMEDNMEEIRKNLAKKALLKWKLFCERKIFRRTYENSLPNSPWVPMLINSEFITTGAVNPLSAYKKHCCLSRQAAEKIEKQNATKPGWEIFNPDHIYINKNLSDIPSVYTKKSGLEKLFKIILVFPSESDDNKFSIFIDWIFSKFGLSEIQKEPSNLSVPLKLYSLHDGKTLISVRAVRLGHFLKSDDYVSFFDGLSAMILCMPSSFLHYEEFKLNLDQFGFLLDADRLMYPYPLFVFLVASEQNYDIRHHVSSFLNEKFDSGYFSCLKLKYIIEATNFIDNSKEVICALTWLTENQKCFPRILCSNFRHFLDDSFASIFNILYWKVSFDEFKPLKLMPHHVINFYNSVLSCRASLLTSDLLLRVSITWPPEELLMLCPDFKFINMQVQHQVKDLIKQIFLPKFNGNPSSVQDLFDYVGLVSKLAATDSHMLTMSIKRLLTEHPIDWLVVASKCAYHLLSAWSSKICNGDKISVHYMKEDLDNIDVDDLWQSIESDFKNLYSGLKRKLQFEEAQSAKKQKNELPLSEPANFREQYKDLYYCHDSNAFGVQHSPCSEIDTLFSPLQIALKKEKEEADSFDHKLRLFSENSPFKDNKQNVGLECQKPIRERIDSLSNENSKVFQEHEVQESVETDESIPKLGVITDFEWKKYIPVKMQANSVSLSSIAEKLSDLQYNIHKNNILEENLTFLLQH